MQQHLIVRGAIITVIALSLFSATAQATSECSVAAADAFRTCKADCKDEFRAAKLSCRGVEPVCGTACQAGRQVCFDAVDAALDTGQVPGGGTLTNCTDGTDGCKARLQTDKATCGAPCAPGNTVCDTCVDGFQVTAFGCRDTCRESWRSNTTLDALRDSCRATFKACIAACPAQ